MGLERLSVTVKEKRADTFDELLATDVRMEKLVRREPAG
jgi:hypothetical protein